MLRGAIGGVSMLPPLTEMNLAKALDLGEALRLAFGHLERGRPAEARRLARQLEHQRPGLPGLAYLLGLIALAEGEGRKAAQHLAKALQQTPDASPPLLAMARAQANQGRDPEAEGYYRRLVAVAPDSAEAMGELAELLLRAGRASEAVAPLRHATVLRPRWAAALNNLGVAERTIGRSQAAALAFARAVDAQPGLAKAHANLAATLRRLGRPDEAAASALRAVVMQPAEAVHWFELAEALGGCGEAGPADAYARALRLDPADGLGASLALARLGAAPVPARAPDAFVRTLFDQYAERFDQDLVERLGYAGPAVLADSVRRIAGEGPLDIIDIGCGTGLAGVALLPLARRLDGVDISGHMAARASARGVYDNVTVGELTETLLQRPRGYDLVSAADVLIYLGDLAPIFAAVAMALRPGGCFAATVEAVAGEGYCVQASGRFAHSAAYLYAVAGQAGLTLVLMEEQPVRREHGEAVPGFVFVARKPAG